MPKEVPQYESGVKLKNNESDNEYVVDSHEYDQERCQLMYVLQGQRYHFNKFKVSSSTIRDNIKNGSYKVIDES